MGDSSRRFGSQDNLLSMGDDDRGVDPAPPAPRRRTSNSDATNGANGRSASNGRPRGVRANPREPLLHPQNGARGQPVNSQPRYTPEEVEELRRRRLAEIEQIEQELELKYGAESVLALIKPVSVCMIVVIATIRSVAYFSTNDTQFVYTPYESNNPNASNSEKFGGAILNALIIIGIVVGMTCVLLLLYKYRCYKAIHGWLLLSSLLLLFFFSYQFVDQVLRAYNSTLDWITMVVSIWNFGVVGLICIHWKGPLLLQQVYLVAVSALMALVLIKNLPDWTTWVVLAAIAIYDLVAVLSPCGPLKALVETAQERDEPLFPALIYSSTMAWIVNMADTGERTQTQSTSLTNGAQTQPQQQQQQQRGGSGDGFLPFFKSNRLRASLHKLMKKQGMAIPQETDTPTPAQLRSKRAATAAGKKGKERGQSGAAANRNRTSNDNSNSTNDDNNDSSSSSGESGGARRPRSAFELYCDRNREDVAHRFRLRNKKHLQAKLANMWQALGTEERVAWIDEAAALKRAWEEKMKSAGVHGASGGGDGGDVANGFMVPPSAEVQYKKRGEGGKRKKKKKKGNGFLAWLEANKAELKRKHAGMPLHKLLAVAKTQWNNLSDADKAQWAEDGDGEGSGGDGSDVASASSSTTSGDGGEPSAKRAKRQETDGDIDRTLESFVTPPSISTSSSSSSSSSSPSSLPPFVVSVNRSPVLILWVAVVARLQGHTWCTGLTLGRALADAFAAAKGARLGIATHGPAPSSSSSSSMQSLTSSFASSSSSRASSSSLSSVTSIRVLGRDVEVEQTPLGVRARSRGRVVSPLVVMAHLRRSFKQQLQVVCRWLWLLGQAAPNPMWLDTHAYGMYTRIRPQVGEAASGWGRAGEFTSRACAEEMKYVADLVKLQQQQQHTD